MNYHIVGTIYEPPPLDADGEPIGAPNALPGYHVNTTAPIPDADAYRVTPTVPYRVIAGVETFFYRFPDRDTWLSFGIEQPAE